MSRSADLSTIQLTPRDIQIILMVYHFDGLITKQLKRRFWGQNKTLRPCQIRLARLIKQGYLKGTRLPPTHYLGYGTGPLWITLGPASYPTLKRQLRLSSQDLKRLRHSFAPLFWQHEVALRDIRLSLELACEASGGLVRLDEWTSEKQLRSSPITVKLTGEGGSSQHLETVPDGVFQLRLWDGRTKRFFLELDRDTLVSPTRFKQRFSAYLHHLKDKPEPVLIVVPDERRRAQLILWCLQEAKRLGLSPSLFVIALQRQVSEDSILTELIWERADGQGFCSLLPQEGQLIPAVGSDGPTHSQLSSAEWLKLLYGQEGGS